jgi:RNA polymerase sigma factor (sigma-70 family)
MPGKSRESDPLRTNPPNEETERAWVADFVASGKARFFEQLVRRYQTMVQKACYQVLRNRQDAEDATQETFLVLLRNAQKFVGVRSLAASLRHVAVCKARDLRASQYSRRRRESQVLRPRTVAQDASDGEDLRSRVTMAIEILPRPYREAFTEYHLAGRSLAQTAKKLGCTKELANYRLRRARQRLQEEFKRRGWTAGTLAVPPFLTLQWETHSAGSCCAPAPPNLSRVAPSPGMMGPPAGLAFSLVKCLFRHWALSAVAVPVAVGALCLSIGRPGPSRESARPVVRSKAPANLVAKPGAGLDNNASGGIGPPLEGLPSGAAGGKSVDRALSRSASKAADHAAIRGAWTDGTGGGSAQEAPSRDARADAGEGLIGPELKAEMLKLAVRYAQPALEANYTHKEIWQVASDATQILCLRLFRPDGSPAIRPGGPPPNALHSRVQVLRYRDQPSTAFVITSFAVQNVGYYSMYQVAFQTRSSPKSEDF